MNVEKYIVACRAVQDQGDAWIAAEFDRLPLAPLIEAYERLKGAVAIDPDRALESLAGLGRLSELLAATVVNATAAQIQRRLEEGERP